jgi:hypothetical protein
MKQGSPKPKSWRAASPVRYVAESGVEADATADDSIGMKCIHVTSDPIVERSPNTDEIGTMIAAGFIEEIPDNTFMIAGLAISLSIDLRDASRTLPLSASRS